MSDKPRFLIPDGYTIESRNQFDSVGMTLAGQLYADLLVKRLPGAEYDIWYSSDPGATLVDGVNLAVERFESQHPTLTGTLRNILQSLANMGI